MSYDYLVIATGARHAYFGHDDWEPYAPGLKRIEDATEQRRRILLAFERAEIETDADERAASSIWSSSVAARPASNSPAPSPNSPAEHLRRIFAISIRAPHASFWSRPGRGYCRHSRKTLPMTPATARAVGG